MPIVVCIADTVCYFNGTIMLLHTAEMKQKNNFLFIFKVPTKLYLSGREHHEKQSFSYFCMCALKGKTFGLGSQICLSVHNIFLTSSKLNQKETRIFILYAVLDQRITTIFSYMWVFSVHK